MERKQLGVVTTVAVDFQCVDDCICIRNIQVPKSLQVIWVTFLSSLKRGRRADGAQILSAGFSCQPFSRLGDQRSGNDPRSESLPKALKAAYYLQSKVVLLECVTPAGSDRFVSQCLDHFIKLTGFQERAN